jgi:hypothetical protein
MLVVNAVWQVEVDNRRVKQAAAAIGLSRRLILRRTLVGKRTAW